MTISKIKTFFAVVIALCFSLTNAQQRCRGEPEGVKIKSLYIRVKYFRLRDAKFEFLGLFENFVKNQRKRKFAYLQKFDPLTIFFKFL
jgi:hypothetical protein